MKKSPYALEVTQLTTHYGRTPALWDIDLKIPTGAIIGILGPNGAGKSTFIKAILNLIPSITGKVRLLGKSIQDIQKKISYVPQKEAVDWDFPITVEELVFMGRYSHLGLFKRLRQADYSAAQHYLEILGLESYAKRQISQLSGGQQQRAFLARSLMQEAEIYFLDEPFAGIDQTSEKLIIDLLHRIVQKGKTVFIVHHDLNSAQKYFDWLIMLNMYLVASGPTADVFTKENLSRAYGSNPLFEEVIKISQEAESGKVL